MNLKMSHLPVLFGGALTGAASGYLLCVVARVFFPHVEDLPSLGLVFGCTCGNSDRHIRRHRGRFAQPRCRKCLHNSPASTASAQHSMAEPIGTMTAHTLPLSGSRSSLSPYYRFVLIA